MIPLPIQIIITAITASILAGITCSLIGVFVVQMKLSSIGFCMSHAAFAGAALGLLLSTDPLITALAFATVIALILGPLSEKAKLSPEVIIGIMFSLTMGLGFIFLNFTPGLAATRQALGILWGSIFSVTIDDLILLGLLTFFIVLLLILFFKEFQALMFNRKLAEASGINTSLFYFLILFLIGVTVAFSLKLVGGLLVFALIVNPASSALQFIYDLKKVMVVSPLIGASTCLLGFFSSLLLNFPIGSSIIIVSSFTFCVSVILSPKRRRG
ncbi:metal ABC transporter permease [Candidatus Bathyarchaeota archaeon]|nr:MAG: metal ABC transporter permease [Candidatus Bathyarchaeota archaeon]